jgi:anion-transporting  ArsA/GET3 family ATPase
VVDTAPVGHTLRLFEMPQHFARFLDFLDAAGSRDRILAQRFGGHVSREHPFIGEWRRIVDEVQKALAAPESSLVLVTTPETFALNESVRAARTLAENSPDLHIRQVVLNRTIASAAKCERCMLRLKMTRSAEVFLKKNFRGVRLLRGEDTGGPVMTTRLCPQKDSRRGCSAARSRRRASGERMAETQCALIVDHRQGRGGQDHYLRCARLPRAQSTARAGGHLLH